ncbi:MAG TPA: hypothetical protein ENN85_01330 [Methanoculleus sp.]|nr:hypothetical protein [Methanoculleus sp.]
MKRRRNIPVRALGAEVGLPGADELAAWIGRQHGRPGDLLSYQIDRSLEAQHGIDYPCAGGLFYRSRWERAIAGVEQGRLVADPEPVAGPLAEDAHRIASMRKKAWVAAPAPSMLAIENSFFAGEDEYYAALADVYRRLTREMRDAGVGGHVLIAEAFDPVEIEALTGRKMLLFATKQTPRSLAALLEEQDRIAVFGRELSSLLDLLGEYDVRQLVIVDPAPEHFEAVLEHFDPGSLAAGGYCTESCDRYWNDLAEAAHLLL